MVSKKKWLRDKNRFRKGRVRNYEGLAAATAESDMQKLKHMAGRLCRPYLKYPIPEDVLLGFSGIVLNFELFELEEAIKLFMDIHQHFLAQNKLRWKDYIFGGNTPSIEDFLDLLDIGCAKDIVYNTSIEADFIPIDKDAELELPSLKYQAEDYASIEFANLPIDDMVDIDIKHAKYTIESVWDLPPIGGTYNHIQLPAVDTDNQIEPSTELEYDESYYLPIDDMVDIDKEAQIELANKQSLSKLRSEYLEAMDKWKSACKDLKLGGYKCEVDNHPAYAKWQGMLNRAYGASSSKWYDNVTVSDSFKHYHIFKRWYLTQYLEEGWELDKDLLLKGNKVYCASRCCFLPKEINSALAINRSLIPMLAEKYRKVLNKDIYNALL